MFPAMLLRAGRGAILNATITQPGPLIATVMCPETSDSKVVDPTLKAIVESIRNLPNSTQLIHAYTSR